MMGTLFLLALGYGIGFYTAHYKAERDAGRRPQPSPNDTYGHMRERFFAIALGIHQLVADLFRLIANQIRNFSNNR